MEVIKMESKCEVCNRKLKDNNTIYIQFRDYSKTDHYPVVREYELCNECAKKVKSFINNLGAKGYEI